MSTSFGGELASTSRMPGVVVAKIYLPSSHADVVCA